MKALQHHFRNTMLAGAFAAVPIVVTIVLAVYVEHMTREPLTSIGLNIPGLGLLLAVVIVYLVGLFVTSVVGKFFMRIVDGVLLKVPAIGELYKAWKQVSLNPEGSTGIYTRVVLVPDDS